MERSCVSHRSSLSANGPEGAHSIEEYATRLYEVFAPARFVSGLISNDLAPGFLIFNGCAGHVRFVVLGYSGTLRLARSPRLSLVLDNSVVGQWHRPHGYSAVARGLLPWRGDRSAAAAIPYSSLYSECMARMISTTIRLHEEDVRALKRARAAGHSASELVRKGLRVVASRYYAVRRLPSTLLFESTDTKLGDESELFRNLED